MIGGGDSASGKKSRKGVVIFIVLVVLLALVGGGLLLWQNGVFGGRSGNGSSSSQQNSLQKAYNSYVNYVLWGVESDGKPDLSAIEDVVKPYFESLQDDTGGSALNAYVTRANEKYEIFKQAYDAEEIKNKLNIAVLKIYFEELPLVETVNVTKMITAYSEKGETDVRDNIDKVYAKNVDVENYLNTFLDKQKQLAYVTLNLIVKASVNNCIQNNRISLNCSGLADEDKSAWNEAIVIANDSSTEIKGMAFTVIEGVYGSLYNTGGGNE